MFGLRVPRGSRGSRVPRVPIPRVARVLITFLLPCYFDVRPPYCLVILMCALLIPLLFPVDS